MNILVISPVYSPSQGGTEVQVSLLTNELIRRGNAVTVITSGETESHCLEQCVSVYRFVMPKTPLDYVNGYLFIRNNRKRIRDLINTLSPDIIHIHQIEMSVSFVQEVKEITGAPIILTVHTSASFTQSDIVRMVTRVMPIRHIERNAIRQADAVIAVSKDLLDYCNTIRQCTFIPNGIDLSAFKNERTCYGLHTPIRIVCPGRISDEKGQQYLIEATERLSGVHNVRTYFVGAGTLQATKHCKHIPAIPYSEIADCYRKADLIVIPSLYESFGLSALENMALGNVVIASDVGGLSRLIRHNENGLLFRRGDVQDMINRIRFAIENNDVRERIGRGATTSAEPYGITHSVTAIESVYRNTIWGGRKEFQSGVAKRFGEIK